MLADGKREHDYDVAITHARYISQILNGGFDPVTANPIRREMQQAIIEANADPRGKEAFDMLGAGLRLIAGGR